MERYFKISGWLAFFAAAVLLLWGAQVIATLVLDVRVPGGSILLLPFLGVSFLLYELAMLNFALLLGQRGERAGARLYHALWIAPLVLIAAFVLVGLALPRAPMTAFYIVSGCFVLYTLVMMAAGYRTWRADGVARLGAAGLALALAGFFYLLQSLSAMAGTAGLSLLASQGVFWLMIAGGACIAAMQVLLGRRLVK